RIRRASSDGQGGIDLEIVAPYRGLTTGESIAVDGACLTVTRRIPGGFRVTVTKTSLERTLFADAAAGDRVNLERAVRAGDRLGGHWVQGHVDGIATVGKVKTKGDAILVDLAVPKPVVRVSVPLGSITVQGVSLTVNELGSGGIIQVSLIPY